LVAWSSTTDRQVAQALHGDRGQRRSGQRGGADVHGELERAPVADLALDPELAAHQLHQPARDGETEPRAPVAASGGAIGLRERVEDQPLRVGGDSDAGVAHGDVQNDAIRARDPGRDEHRHFAALGELDGVADQVEQHLADSAGVPLDATMTQYPASFSRAIA
jgi:hypothetical protein